MTTEQLALFDAKPTRLRRRTVPPNEQPQWSKYNQRAAARPYQCDFCVLNCHDDVMAPIPRKARYIRKTSEDTLYLCLTHANDQRIIDGLTVIRHAT